MDTSPVIENDLPCAICGYNLKGLTEDANCPECGQPIARTLEIETDFSRSNPQWLRSQAVTMLILASLGWINGRLEINWGYPRIINYIFSGAVLIAVVVGVFRLSSPELPYARSGGSFDPWRRGIGAASVCVAAILITSFLPLTIDYRLRGLLGFALIAAQGALNWLVATFLYRLARRTGENGLIAHARLIQWALPLAYLIHIGIAFIDQSTSSPVTFYVSGVVSCLSTIVVYAYVLLLGRLNQALRHAALANSSTQSPASTS